MPDHLFQKGAVTNITGFTAWRAPGNLFDAMQGFRVAVIKIIDHNDVVACLDELNAGVRTNIAGTASHKNCHRLCIRLLNIPPRCAIPG